MSEQTVDTNGGSAYEPRLRFSDKAWEKVVLYTTLCQFEIGGLGLVRADGPDYVCDDLFLVDQEVNDIATRFDGGSVSLLIARLIDSDVDPVALRLWWHSHARESTFWSGEDEQTIAGFSNDYMISIVTNHQMRMLARLDRYVPRSTEWVWVDRPEIVVDSTSEAGDSALAEIANVVTHVPRHPRRSAD